MALEGLTKDNLVELFLQSDLSTINKLCSLNKQLNELCNDENLWQQKYIAAFGPRLVQVKSWKHAYQLRVNPKIPFVAKWSKLDENNSKTDEIIETDCVIDLSRTKINFDRDENDFGHKSLIVIASMRIKVCGNETAPMEIKDDDYFVESVKEAMRPYFNNLDDLEYDHLFYRDHQNKNYLVYNIGQKLVVEILDLCRD